MFSKTATLCSVLAFLLAGCTTQDRGRRPRRYRPLYEEDISVQARLPEKDRPPVQPPPVPPKPKPKPQPPPAPPVQPPPEPPKPQPPPQALPAAEVERLRTLLNLGFITKEEYEQKVSGQNAK